MFRYLWESNPALSAYKVTTLAACGCRAVHIHEVATGNLLATLDHPRGVRSLAWRPDGRILAAACGDRHLHVWDVDRQCRVLQLATGEDVRLGSHGGDKKISA